MGRTSSKGPKRIGVVGYGHLGKFLVSHIQEHPGFELDFVWNRTLDKLEGTFDSSSIIKSLDQVPLRNVDIIIEVADPCITKEYGEMFLTHADYVVGSPTAFADKDVEERLRKKAESGIHGLYIPVGALWGEADLRKMAAERSLRGLKITMAKHPCCFKLQGKLQEKNANVTERVTLYDGPVRDLCPLAPNNVNTMACAAIAASNLGFDGVQGCLVADPSLNTHIIEIEAIGPGDPGNEFRVKTVRTNPSAHGVVTGNATYGSFFRSLLAVGDKGPGIHFC